MLRLAFDCAAAAALMHDGEGAGSRPVIRFAIVGHRDAAAARLQAALHARGVDVTVELFALPSIPRGPGGKVNRAQLKAALASAKPFS